MQESEQITCNMNVYLHLCCHPHVTARCTAVVHCVCCIVEHARERCPQEVSDRWHSTVKPPPGRCRGELLSSKFW